MHTELYVDKYMYISVYIHVHLALYSYMYVCLPPSLSPSASGVFGGSWVSAGWVLGALWSFGFLGAGLWLHCSFFEHKYVYNIQTKDCTYIYIYACLEPNVFDDWNPT